jgi:hypothetical protein
MGIQKETICLPTREGGWQGSGRTNELNDPVGNLRRLRLKMSAPCHLHMRGASPEMGPCLFVIAALSGIHSVGNNGWLRQLPQTALIIYLLPPNYINSYINGYQCIINLQFRIA